MAAAALADIPPPKRRRQRGRGARGRGGEVRGGEGPVTAGRGGERGGAARGRGGGGVGPRRAGDGRRWPVACKRSTGCTPTCRLACGGGHSALARAGAAGAASRVALRRPGRQRPPLRCAGSPAPPGLQAPPTPGCPWARRRRLVLPVARHGDSPRGVARTVPCAGGSAAGRARYAGQVRQARPWVRGHRHVGLGPQAARPAATLRCGPAARRRRAPTGRRRATGITGAIPAPTDVNAAPGTRRRSLGGARAGPWTGAWSSPSRGEEWGGAARHLAGRQAAATA